MPIYEYQCRKCKREFSFLYGMTPDSTDPRCPRCGSRRLNRLLSRFHSPRSEEAMLDGLEPTSVDADNPRDVMKWIKRFGKEMGDEAGDDFADEMEAAFEEEMAAEGNGERPASSERDEIF